MKNEKAQIAATAMSNLVNSFSTDNSEFIEKMGNDHRTLQQGFTRLCLEWLEYVASDDYRTDGRNEASKEVAKILIKNETIEEIYGEKPSKWLPMI